MTSGKQSPAGEAHNQCLNPSFPYSCTQSSLGQNYCSACIYEAILTSWNSKSYEDFCDKRRNTRSTAFVFSSFFQIFVIILKQIHFTVDCLNLYGPEAILLPREEHRGSYKPWKEVHVIEGWEYWQSEGFLGFTTVYNAVRAQCSHNSWLNGHNPVHRVEDGSTAPGFDPTDPKEH